MLKSLPEIGLPAPPENSPPETSAAQPRSIGRVRLVFEAFSAAHRVKFLGRSGPVVALI